MLSRNKAATLGFLTVLLVNGGLLAEERTYDIQWRAVAAYHRTAPATEIYADEPAVFVLELTATQTGVRPRSKSFRQGLARSIPKGRVRTSRSNPASRGAYMCGSHRGEQPVVAAACG